MCHHICHIAIYAHFVSGPACSYIGIISSLVTVTSNMLTTALVKMLGSSNCCFSLLVYIGIFHVLVSVGWFKLHTS